MKLGVAINAVTKTVRIIKQSINALGFGDQTEIQPKPVRTPTFEALPGYCIEGGSLA
jgi:hypothetical protein